MTYPHITQTSDYASDDGEHSQWHADSPVRPLQEFEQAATPAKLEDPCTPNSEGKSSLPLTFNHLCALDEGEPSGQQLQLRSDSTAVTVSSETRADSPIAPSEPVADTLHESPVEISPTISPTTEEELVSQPDELEQLQPASPEPLPPPYVSPPSTPPTSSKAQNAFRSFASLQNDVTEVTEHSSGGSSANEEPMPDAQPVLVPQPETLTVPSNGHTMELASPVESEVFVYPVESSPSDPVATTTVEPESPEDDVFRYPADELVEPTPVEPVEPIAPAPRRPFRDRHTDLEEISSRDPAPAYRPHSPHFSMPSSTVRSQRYSLTEDMLPAPEIFSPVPVPIRASALTSARTVARESFNPSRVDSNDYNRYSPRPRQTSSPAPPPATSVTVEDVNDASSDLGDASATGALGDARKKRRRKKNNKPNRRSVTFSDDDPEVIGSASDWAMESGEESGGAPLTAVNQFDQHFTRHMSLPQVSSPLARSSVPIVRDSDFSPSLANPDKAEVLSPTSSVDSRGALPSYKELHSPGSSRAASPSPSIGSVGSNADGDWSARKVDAYGRWYQAINKHQPVCIISIASHLSD
jgi:hypothetical protein